MRSMIDFAFPIVPVPVKTDIVLVYVGGDTPHPWTDSDMHSQPARYRWPTWVRSNPNGATEGATEAAEMIAWLKAHNVPLGVSVILDLETAVDTAYVNAFNSTMAAAGYHTTKYGSSSTIFKNPRTTGGTFVADPTGTPHMYSIGDTVATQYAFDGGYDLSMVEDQTVLDLWDTNPTSTEPAFPVPVPIPAEIAVVLEWNTVIGAESYHYALVRVNDGAVIADSSTPNTMVIVKGLQAGFQYRWRVAVHATATTRSSAWLPWEFISV